VWQRTTPGSDSSWSAVATIDIGESATAVAMAKVGGGETILSVGREDGHVTLYASRSSAGAGGQQLDSWHEYLALDTL
jgi:hypothetical protein